MLYYVLLCYNVFALLSSLGGSNNLVVGGRIAAVSLWSPLFELLAVLCLLCFGCSGLLAVCCLLCLACCGLLAALWLWCFACCPSLAKLCCALLHCFA